MDNLDKDIGRVLDNYYQVLEQKGYSKHSIAHYRTHAEKFRRWCNDNEVKHFSESIAIQYCTEQIGSYIFSSGLTNNQKDALRAIRMIVGLEKDGKFEIRGPQREYNYRVLADFIYGHLDRYIDRKRPSLSSLQDRKRVLVEFDIFLQGKEIRIKDITPDLFEDFFSGRTPYGRKMYKTHIREFYRDLHDTGILETDLSTLIQKEPHVSKPMELPSTYTMEEVKRIISSVDRSSPNGKRNYLAILLASEYGMRASDIINLRFNNIDWDNNRIDIIQEKTHNHVQFPLLASIGNAIIDYVKNGRPPTGNDIILVRHDSQFKGLPLSNSLIYNVVSKAIADAEINDWRAKKHGPHSLRHSLATNLLKKGTNLSVISNALGHKTSETTQVYIHIDIEKLRMCSLQIPAITSKYFRKEGEK